MPDEPHRLVVLALSAPTLGCSAKPRLLLDSTPSPRTIRENLPGRGVLIWSDGGKCQSWKLVKRRMHRTRLLSSFSPRKHCVFLLPATAGGTVRAGACQNKALLWQKLLCVTTTCSEHCQICRRLANDAVCLVLGRYWQILAKVERQTTDQTGMTLDFCRRAPRELPSTVDKTGKDED